MLQILVIRITTLKLINHSIYMEISLYRDVIVQRRHFMSYRRISYSCKSNVSFESLFMNLYLEDHLVPWISDFSSIKLIKLPQQKFVVLTSPFGSPLSYFFLNFEFNFISNNMKLWIHIKLSLVFTKQQWNSSRKYKQTKNCTKNVEEFYSFKLEPWRF